MAEYIGIKGSTIQTIAGDPPAPQVGQVWYNTTSTVLKGYGAQGTGAWASGGLLNAMTMQMGSAGTQTATLSFGGTGDPGLRATNESYNGSAWTELADLNTARQGLQGLGIQTAAMAMGGQVPANSALSETWNGTSWSEGNNILKARCKGMSAGTTTAGLIAGGVVTQSSWTVGYADTEEYSDPAPIVTKTVTIS